ncbi:hypothetical protein pb186bvf_005637 [Paramecium bursaria]
MENFSHLLFEYDQKTRQFYEQRFSQKLLRGLLRLPKRCAYTLNKLSQPVRSGQCNSIECVYDLDVIKILINARQSENKGEYQCIICGTEISWENLFFDSIIGEILLVNGPCFIDSNLKIQQKLKGQQQKPLELNFPQYTPPFQKTENFDEILNLTLLKNKINCLHEIRTKGSNVVKEMAELIWKKI